MIWNFKEVVRLYEDCIYKDWCKLECRFGCARYIEMDYLLEHSGIPKSKQRKHKLTPESCDVDAFNKLANIQQNIEDFVDSDSSLYLYSCNCGNGKTTWTVKLMLQYFNSVWECNGLRTRGLFIHVPTFLNKCKIIISYPDPKFEALRIKIPEVDLVVFDDISACRLSDYDYTNLLSLIDQRVFNEKTSIYTGNVKPTELHEIVGHRLASRICKGTIIELKGLDRRHDWTANNK